MPKGFQLLNRNLHVYHVSFCFSSQSPRWECSPARIPSKSPKLDLESSLHDDLNQQVLQENSEAPDAKRGGDGTWIAKGKVDPRLESVALTTPRGGDGKRINQSSFFGGN